jgi:hypothetical protein
VDRASFVDVCPAEASSADALEPARSLLRMRLRELGTRSLSRLLEEAPEQDLLSPELSAAARRARPQLVAALAGHPSRRAALAAWLAGELRDQLLRAWTYAELGAAAEARLEALSRRVVDEAVAALAEPTAWEAAERILRARIAAHCAGLRALAREIVGAGEGTGTHPAGVPAAPPPCHEYAPELQLAVLGVEVEALRPPVLDLGCGRSGALVHHLRGLGVAALGVDRVAPSQPGFVRASWLELPLAHAFFGTILSHQAFALHFVHAHLRDREAASRYARRYREILEALRPGGSFHYAPGLPFVERHLEPARFAVHSRPLPLPPPADPDAARALEAALEGPPGVTRVIRRPRPGGR